MYLICIQCGTPFRNFKEAIEHCEKFHLKGQINMKFSGTTEQAGGPILGAKYWKKGIKIFGTVTGSFETQNGDCYNIKLTKPITIDGKSVDNISIGAMAGFEMALQAANVPNRKLLAGDKIFIECTGSTPTDKGNPRIDFAVEVDRP